MYWLLCSLRVQIDFFIWKKKAFLSSFIPLCPIDAQGIELDREKKAVCFEKKQGRAVCMPHLSPSTAAESFESHGFLAASSAKNSFR
jgi:hypothetical protein